MNEDDDVTIDIVNETSAEVDAERVHRLIAHSLWMLHVHPSAEVTVMFVDEDHMERLHIQWMDEPGPTDVLSFPMDELRPGTATSPSGPGYLGDIVVCPSVAATQASSAGHSAEHEMDILVAHGVLHLLGYDHITPEEEKVMFELQEHIVAGFVERDTVS